MTDTYGPTSPILLAEWTHHPDCLCSRTSLGCSLLKVGTLWPESFTTWPNSGMWDRGGFYELPTLAPVTEETDGSVLLPTPSGLNGGQTSRGGNRKDELLLGGIVKLLPTPVANDDGKTPEAHMAMKRRMPGGPRQTITVLARNDFSQPPAPPTRTDPESTATAD